MGKRIRRWTAVLLALLLLTVPAWGAEYDYNGRMEDFFEESGAGELMDKVPEETKGLLDQLDSLRERVKAELPGEKRRSGLFAELFAAGMERGGPLPPEEAEELLRRYREGGNEGGV